MTARLLRIEGRVQGVGYRDWLRRQAQAAGLSGWVRNRPDGSVQALLAGPAAAVAATEAACQRGPLLARVTAVQGEAAEAPAGAGFRKLADG